MSGERRGKISRALCLGFLLVLFLLQYSLFGYNRAIDTAALEGFSHEVYPLYPVMLHLFRAVLGADAGYYLLGVFQNIVLALSIFSLTDYLRGTYKLSTFIFWSASAAVAFMFLAQKWLSRAGTIYSNTLLSEALALPFYLLFFRYALESFISRERRPFLLSCLWAALLILTRGQFYWVLAVVFLNGTRLIKLDRVKALCCAVLACVGILVPVQAARALQTKYIHMDEQTKNPANFIVLTTAVYCSDSNDWRLFDEGSGERRLLEAVRAYMDNPENLVAFSRETGSLIERHGEFESEYDDLKEVVKAAYRDITAEGTEISLGKITRRLVLANPVSFLLHCGQNALAGMIRTVSLLRPGLDLFALLLYLLIVLIIVVQRNSAICQFLFLGLLCSLLNAAVMAPGVFAQFRYVFYNMPILYLGLGVYVTKMCEKLLSGEKLPWNTRP